jgi:acetylornithine/N-succinyldiaminopimelate aminotransferase
MLTMTGQDPIALDAQHVLQVYRRAPVVFESGQGCALFTREGERYLDLISGVGVAALGHGHPGLARAIAEQASTLLHTSNLFHHPLQAELASRLAAMSGLPRAFFCNSGAEAMEACLKFARRYWFTKGQPRPGFVALNGSFHGRTFGALSVTGTPGYREPFAPLVPGVTFVDLGDAAALDAAVSADTAAIVVEPIQGEGGVRPMSPAFAAAVRAAADRTGALVIADEVQSGLGRTGQPFHARTLGLNPDLISIGKAIGGGVPIGASLVREAVAAAVFAGDHGSTYGGNLLACRAALHVVDQLLDGSLLAHVREVGAHFERRLAELAAAHVSIKESRGAGVIRGLELDRPASQIVEAARPLGLLVNATAGTVVRLLPPLTVAAAEIDEAVATLDRAFAAVEGAQS